MCYYNGQKVTREEFIRLKQLEKALANYDFLNRDLQIGFDYGMNAVCKAIPGKEDFDLVEMEWGFLPDSWFRQPIDTREKAERFRKGFPNIAGKMEPGITTLNAMAEELLLPGKIYRESALERRCLVPSHGFFEWRHLYGTNKRTGQPLKTPKKIPYHISLKGKNYFYIAGIWKQWTDKVTGECVDTFALVTTKANKIMEQIHNSKMRMPTILNEDLGYEWMFGKLDEKRISEIAVTQYPAEEMQACTIAKDFREALEPAKEFQYEDVPALELSF
ncbi:MAG: response-associated peptidase [Chitinophagaceae bacterium]|nr:response-associated peptidase [Chitinophagaceae bacterium]